MIELGKYFIHKIEIYDKIFNFQSNFIFINRN